MPRKRAKAKVENKSTKRRVKVSKKLNKPIIKRSLSLESAEVVKMQKEFLRIEDEVVRHIASRAPKIPLAKPQMVSNTYFISNEECLGNMRSSLKRLKRE
ncbi:MAG: hypothetical protein WC356_00395 [Candidatus Micrarchaeia archaeon]|jgi:hypothetical protein